MYIQKQLKLTNYSRQLQKIIFHITCPKHCTTRTRAHNISTTIFVHLLTIHSTCDLSLIFVNKTSFMLYEGHEEVMIFCHRKLSIHNQLSLWMDTTLFLNCNEIVSRKHVLIKIIYESVQGGCTNVSLTCYIITGE